MLNFIYLYLSLSIYIWMTLLLHCFHLLAVYNATMKGTNRIYKYLFECLLQILWSIYSGVELLDHMVILRLPRWLTGKESACNEGDLGSITGSGRSSGEGHSNPLQHSCLKNPMSRGVWQPTAFFIVQLLHPYMTPGKTMPWLDGPLLAK